MMFAWTSVTVLCFAQDSGSSDETQYGSPERFENEIQRFEALDKKGSPPQGAIVCVGSSSMRGWHATIHNDLAPLTIVPRGFGGSTMNDALHYADRIVLHYKPRAVVVYEGDNDVAAGISPQTITDTFQAFVEKVHKELPQCRIYFLTIKPSIHRWTMWPKMKEANSLIATVCAKDKRLSFVDVASGMLSEEGNPRKKIFQEDGLHMTRDGYVIWRDALKPILIQSELQYEKSYSDPTTARTLSPVPLTGISQLTELDYLPLLRPEVEVHYEGSIAKVGNNADWDWWLYQDDKSKEWVICETEGPGCLWNFVVHHAIAHSDVVYRFYIDGDTSPAFEIKHSEFGRKHPFSAPLADEFIPNVQTDKRLHAWDFRIVRSFCPMPFTKKLRITSSVKLKGNSTTNGGGGWGHAMWHSYPTAAGVTSFHGKENYAKLIHQWQRVGEDPKPTFGNKEFAFDESLPAKTSRVLFESQEAGSLAAIRLTPTSRENLSTLWIKITWEGEETPAIECPLGAFFGNEFGKNNVQTLMMGTTQEGTLYNYWPMPFWQSAKVEVVNRGGRAVQVAGTVTFKPSSMLSYPREHTGHFRASAYQPMVAKTPKQDSPIATIYGHGHMVAGLITAKSSFCEGDVRVLIDGGGTPVVESDGSESWSCYGWGFVYPPQHNPSSSYDGTGNREWSMLRLLMGDSYPFRTKLQLTVEGGFGVKEGEDLRSGIVFWYGEPQPAMTQTDVLDVGDPASEAAHQYNAPGSTRWELTSCFEGEFDTTQLSDDGRSLAEASEFTVAISPENQGVVLRRRSDQLKRAQRAAVYVDGKRVEERMWFYGDRNPNFRWLEDQFFIPASYTRGKKRIRLRIHPQATNGVAHWNESRYWVSVLH